MIFCSLLELVLFEYPLFSLLFLLSGMSVSDNFAAGSVVGLCPISGQSMPFRLPEPGIDQRSLKHELHPLSHRIPIKVAAGHLKIVISRAAPQIDFLS